MLRPARQAFPCIVTAIVIGLAVTFCLAQQSTQDASENRVPERFYGRVAVNVSRGVRVEVDNRTTGRITINGWDRELMAARAVSERGDEVVIVRSSDEGSGKRLFIKADYADLKTPSAPSARELDDAPTTDDHLLEVHLEISLPRYAQIELIRVFRSDVQVSGIETPLSISGRSSEIILKQVGPVEVRTRSGAVKVEDANGFVRVETSSGAIQLTNSQGAVRAVSISGPIEIRCAQGHIDVANTEAPIELINVDGDVDAITTSSSVRFTGTLRSEGRYYLKSMSGRVEMILPANTDGFNATLSSYRGLVETDFSLENGRLMRDSALNHRIGGRFGDGKAQIILDSFEGLVRLTKAAPASVKSCSPQRRSMTGPAKHS